MIQFNKIVLFILLPLASVILPIFSNQVLASQSKQTSESIRADKIYANYFEGYLELYPFEATFIGDTRYNDKLPNFLSDKYRERQVDFEKLYLKKIEKIDYNALSPQGKLSYDIFKRNRQLAIDSFNYPSHLIPLNQFYNYINTFFALGSGSSAQPFNSIKDYENWRDRMEQFPVIIDQMITNMNEGIKQGVVQPKSLIEKVIPQIDIQLANSLENSLLYKPIAEMPRFFTTNQKQYIIQRYTTAINSFVFPSLEKLSHYLKSTYLPKARLTAGLWDIPNGNLWYQHLIRRHTSTELTADEIHEIGLQEVSRIHEEILEVMKDVNFEGDLDAFFQFTNSNPQFFFKSKDQMLNAYRQFAHKVNLKTPDLFSRFPKSTYEIRPVEVYREQSASSGSYQRPSADGTRPGIFYLNTYDLSARPRWAMASLFLHEAAPGHHFQLALQQELKDLPKFRAFGTETAFVEGWGLYAESLGNELGVYSDPYQHYGALVAELWRSIRLVVDTGLHSKGWSRQKVLDYMYSNAPVAEARAISETERFMAIPGQALAYKIGQLKIESLRDKAESELGAQFDIKAYHFEVLKNGALPLSILEKKIEHWIAKIKTEKVKP
ncbi:DUF885 domain-containing protein [Pleionea sediminis]|uniref:DUF885 domain-containing protein n=1 Tax=Pleionea sediminis TaxID=2569479 RepID=UPI0013DDCB16|nr:DUF885 domain-containing protein [Pleionea sediminis]